MFNLSPSSRFCTYNSKSPIRASQTNAVHPYLRDVNFLRTDSIAPVSGTLEISISSDGTLNRKDNPLPLHRLQQQNSDLASVSEYSDTPTFQPVRDTLAEIAPTPAAVGASERDWTADEEAARQAIRRDFERQIYKETYEVDGGAS